MTHHIDKNHDIISTDAEKHLTDFRVQERQKHSTKWVGGNIPQQNKGHIQQTQS